MGYQRIEWIGAASPLADDRVVFRKITGVYTPEQLDILEEASKLITPLIRQDGSTARLLTPKMGFSQDYLFGPRPGTYVQDMKDEDVKHLFNNLPDEPEFRNLDNPEHIHRVPIVPWAYVDKILYDILRGAAAGPVVTVENVGLFSNPKSLISQYERTVDIEKADHERNKRQQRRNK
jgi:hypothetical protein